MSKTGENIYKRKDGRWEGRFIYTYDINDKAKYKYIYAKTYTELKKKILLAKTSVIELNKPQEKFDYWIEKWLKNKQLMVKESSYINYRNIVKKHISAELGNIDTNKLTTEKLEQYIVNKFQNGRLDGKGGLSYKTVQDILIVIKDILNYAEIFGAKINTIFKRYNNQKKVKEMQVLSPIEQKALSKALLTNLDYKNLGILLALNTGMRIGELCALKWEDINLDSEIIIIKKTTLRISTFDNPLVKTKIITTDPKSFAGKRIIPIPKYLLEILKKMQVEKGAYFLTGKLNKSCEPRVMQYHFKKICHNAQINAVNFHALRHTFATRCIEAGFDVKSLSEILGHSSVKITLDRYVHSSLELKKANMEKLKMMI